MNDTEAEQETLRVGGILHETEKLLAAERARAEKAEAERADWKQAATTHNETIGILGDRLAAAQKEIQRLTALLEATNAPA